MPPPALDFFSTMKLTTTVLRAPGKIVLSCRSDDPAPQRIIGMVRCEAEVPAMAGQFENELRKDLQQKKIHAS